MSHSLISRSPDLLRLQEDGFEIDIVGGNYLAVYNVPYVNAQRQVRFGTLVSDLSLGGDQTIHPANHVMLFAGEHPCTDAGIRIAGIEHHSSPVVISPALTTDHGFSAKPRPEGYIDYYEKVTAYAAVLEKYAQLIEPEVTARTRRVVESTDEDSPFVYVDNASGRANINAVAAKLKIEHVAIVGLGGTGSYILDQLAKTPVRQIHLYDADTFEQHNAFRAPGAASLDDLRRQPKKVDYFAEMYGRMHRGIKPHAEHIIAANVHQLTEAQFVFISMDGNAVKSMLIETLERAGIPFIDVGMGLSETDGALHGILRVTTSTPGKRDHVRGLSRIPLSGGGEEDNIYARNIQVADLNALNAILAVVRYKKFLGFYADLEGEHYSAYTVDGNHLSNEDSVA
jgi:hypothetical protein